LFDLSLADFQIRSDSNTYIVLIIFILLVSVLDLTRAKLIVSPEIESNLQIGLKNINSRFD